ncbi:poly(A)-specific ribonuclease PARN-like [Impatiens glandulifera]|uniref:poly(A)-specific ribonuclease PARN-like n=1 Tax=Impatiens glandulifera TaxID=253017 RepID=UPI001FB0BBE6|nr:poly(A)-specific ribonuclease PARN-like [Impatiens glandulifera]
MKLQWLVVRALSRTLTKPSTVSTSRFFSSSPAPSPDFAIKNVTRQNLDPVLADLRFLIKDADFVSIDLEMTGITTAPWRDSFEFDRSDIRYLKIKDSAEKFAVLQFGVCPFRWDSSNGSFIAHPHNFYIFPRQEFPADSHFHDEFLCQATSIDFLAKHHFDFNLCIREGISYLSRAQEEEALRRLHEELADPRSGCSEFGEKPVTRVVDILFSEKMKCRIQEWQKGFSFEERSNDLDKRFQTVFFKTRPALQLNGFTRNQLRLIQLVIEKHFKELVYIHTKGESASANHYIVYADTDIDKNLLMKEVKEDVHKEAILKIKSAVGFRRVIDILCSEQKLIVGHNCFLDIAHIHSKFFGPLPSTALEYVSSIHNYFPYIIDTKILLNANYALQMKMKKGSTSLSKAFALLCTQISPKIEELGLVFNPHVKVDVQVDDMRSSSWNSGAKHEAGYDAFMTGCVFAQACNYLGFDFNLHPPSGNLALDEKLQKHVNLLYLSWINCDIINLTTGQQMAESSLSPSRKFPSSKIVFQNIIIIWGLSSTKLKARDIRECIAKTFGSTSITSVYHLDETAVFVQFSKTEFVSKFLELKERLTRSNSPISVLHHMTKLFESGKVHAANYEIYKEICDSPLSKVMFADQANAVCTTPSSTPNTSIIMDFMAEDVVDSPYAVEARCSK